MRRGLVRLGLFLLLGAIVNVAVAWGCVSQVSPSVYSQDRICADESRLLREFEETSDGSVLVVSGFGVKRRMITFDDPLAFREMIEARDRLYREYKIMACGGGPGPSWLHLTFAGWPMFSVSGAICYHSRTHAKAHGLAERLQLEHGIAMVDMRTFKPESWFPDAPILPLKPRWSGLAVNTGFYAAILWMLFAGPGGVRRLRRVRRGLCAECGYPVGGSTVCTECGRPIVLRTL